MFKQNSWNQGYDFHPGNRFSKAKSVFDSSTNFDTVIFARKFGDIFRRLWIFGANL